MIETAFKMLIGNRPAFLGMIFGIFLATLLISQQSAIYLGLISRSYRIVSSIPEPDIWVIDPATNGEDLIRGMSKEYLQYVKSVPDIKWAVPVNYMLLPLKITSGQYEVAAVHGLDDQSLVGMPELLSGNAQDLHREGGVILDSNSAENLLATQLPDGTKVPLKIGDEIEINNTRTIIVGIGKITPGFFPQPIVFMTNRQLQRISGSSRLQYIVAKAREGADLNQILANINSNKKIVGLTKSQMKSRISDHFLKTGILINYGISLLLGIIIGFSITGQTFYMMTLQNVGYYALIKALGGTKWMILKMILFQALLVGVVGVILGTGVTLLWGYAIQNTTLAFEYPGILFFLTGSAAILMCLFIAFISMRKVLKADPHLLMVGL